MSTRSRIISTVAYAPPTDPPQATVLTPPDLSTPQALQSARRHPFCANNAGPVQIHRTPEGIIAFHNPEFTPEAPTPPPDRLPPRLRPYTPDDPPPEPPRTIPAPLTPPDTRTTRGQGATGRTAEALRTTYRGRYGKISNSPNSASAARNRYPEAEVQAVTQGPYRGTYILFPAETPAPLPSDTPVPEFIQDPPRRRERARQSHPDRPGPYEVCSPKAGFLHLFLRRDTPASCIPPSLIQQAIRNGDLPPKGNRRVPFDYMASERDRYIPIPTSAADDPALVRLAASEGAFLVHRPDPADEAAAANLAATARPLRHRPLPIRPTGAKRY